MSKRDTAKKVNLARDLAVQLVYDVMENGAYANISLNKTLRKSNLSSSDRSLLTELVNGSIRMRKHLDWVLNFFLKEDLEKQNPWLKNILRVSTYQILFKDRIPDFAVVNDAVEITRKHCNEGLVRVVNGVLRNLIRKKDFIEYPAPNKPEYLAVYYSHPQELVEYLLARFGWEKTSSILAYNNNPARLDIRVNLLQTKPDELLYKLQENGIKCYPSPHLPEGIRIQALDKPLEQLAVYNEGFFYVQNESSMLAAHILDPQPGETVLDLCCGVGGKTTHLAELMENNGLIKAYDFYEHKINILQANCKRLGITIIEEHVADILLLEEKLSVSRILLDVPCSGTGVLNRRADARWNKNDDQIEELSSLQIALLNKAASLLKRGGYLLYSTCSIREEENEQVIESFLNQNREFVLQSFAEQIAFFPLDEEDKASVALGMLTLLPGKYDSDGMFYALLRRK